MRNIIYIINPVSGARPNKNLRLLIEKKMAEKGIPFQLFPSVASGDYSFLHPLIEEQQVTDVVIAGGDGTVSQVVSGLMKYDLNFGIIPCGSGNGLAYTAGIPRRAASALDTILNGKPSLIDGFFINKQFACMLCGLGFDAKVAHDFAKQPKRGLATYVKQVTRNFFSAKTHLFELKFCGYAFTVNAYFISIANSNQFGNNVTIAPRASLSDGLLDIVVAGSSNKLNLLLQILKQILGKNKMQTEVIVKKKEGIIYFQTEKMEIMNPSKAPLHIDGDPAASVDKVTIEIKKKCFRLIQP